MMGTMAVTNFARSGEFSRFGIEVVLDFDVPPERARRILLAGAMSAAAEQGVIADPPPLVILGEATERGVVYRVRFWGDVGEMSPAVMKNAVMNHVLKQLHTAGLSPAVPKEDVFHEQRPKRLLNHEDSEDRVEILSRTELFGRTLEARELGTLAAAVEMRERLSCQSSVLPWSLVSDDGVEDGE